MHRPLRTRSLRRPRSWPWLTAVFLAALAIALLFVPLFNLLGYEFCLVLAGAATLVGGRRGIARGRELGGPLDALQKRTLELAPLRALVEKWLAAAVDTTLLLLVPLVLISANALRVRNCNFTAGLTWFVVLPVAGGVLAAAVGVAAAVITRRAQLLFLFIVVMSVASSIYRFYASPAISIYNAFVGYYPGSLYDEEVTIPAALWLARAQQFASVGAALGLLALGLSASGRLRRPRWNGTALLVVVLCAVPAWYLFARRGTIGFARSQGDVAAALGGVYRTPHFVLHYSPSGPFARDIALYGDDHEFWWSQLAQRLGHAPTEPIDAYLFDSAAHKGALIGAATTSVAKPWRNEIYLQYEPWPHTVLAHELAHVFWGTVGDPLLHVARRGLYIDVALIEGAAVALAWNDRSSDVTVRQLRAARLEPALTDVMSSRFLTLPAAAAYAIAGSFCHFLVEKYGVAPLTEVYRRGGGAAAWQAAYGESLAALGQKWSRSIDALPAPGLPPQHLRQPSVFRRPCAHEIALLRQAAADASRAGDLRHALAILEQVCREAPGDPSSIAAVLTAAWQLGDVVKAQSLAAAVLRHDPTPWLRGRAEALLGDLALQAGNADEAAEHYRAAESAPLDDAEARLVTVKRVLASHPPVPDALVELLLPRPHEGGADGGGFDLLALDRLVRDHPEVGLYTYLLARQLENRRAFADAAPLFAKSRALGLPDRRFTREAAYHQAFDDLRAGALDDAEAAFASLAAVNADDAPVAEEGRARIQWARTHATKP